MRSSGPAPVRGMVFFLLGAAGAAGLLCAMSPMDSIQRASLLPVTGARHASFPPTVPGVVLARFKDNGLDPDRIARDLSQLLAAIPTAHSSPLEEINPDTHDVTIYLDGRVPVGAAIADLKRDSSVVFAEPDGICKASFVPNDPYYDENYDSYDGPIDQWFLRTIDGPKGWDLLRKVDSQVCLAIIDTGVDYTHPDLQNVMARNSKGDLVGRSFVPGTESSIDDHGHGTHCAGIADADTDNGIGVAGVGFQSFRIVPAKVLNAGGAGHWDWIANAITWCADNGCRVESMSLGGGPYSQAMQDAINYAWSKGVIVVAAAGNSASSAPGYPAGCNHVVAVSATDSDDHLAKFSNFGNPIAVGAPGVKVLSTLPSYPCTINRSGRKINYDSLSGTSMACPVVAGILASLIAYQPTLTPTDAVDRLEATADNIAKAPKGGWEAQFGHGRVNLDRALRNDRRTSSVGCFYGQVTGAGGIAVSNARVRCGSLSLTTRADGMFRFANLKPASYSLSATSGSRKGQVSATIVPGVDTCISLGVKN